MAEREAGVGKGTRIGRASDIDSMIRLALSEGLDCTYDISEPVFAVWGKIGGAVVCVGHISWELTRPYVQMVRAIRPTECRVCKVRSIRVAPCRSCLTVMCEGCFERGAAEHQPWEGSDFYIMKH